VGAALLSTALHAQSELPVLRSTSRVITIIDGLHVKKDYWYVMPERAPDFYYVEIPLQAHTVTFGSDSDSLAIPVTYGTRRQFIVRLGDGVEALTEVRAEFRRLLSHQRAASAEGGGIDTIPFHLGDNDKIYLQGKINGSRDLDLQLDLGAGGSLIKKSTVSRVSMTFDGTITLHNSDGTNQVPSSSANQLEIAGLTWNHVDFAVADNMTRREDGIIGNALFRDKVLEIDYGRMVIAIHDSLPELSAAWHREDMVLDGGTVPYVRGTLSIGDSVREGWYLLDTGAYTSILNSDQLSAFGKFRDELSFLGSPFRKGQKGPKLSVGGQTFSGTNYSVRPYDGDASALGLLGNDVLKRFDLIVDNRQGTVYFRPNHNLEAPFRNPERKVVRTAVAVLLVTLGTLAVRRLVRSGRRGNEA
jgi:hypothetical protein